MAQIGSSAESVGDYGDLLDRLPVGCVVQMGEGGGDSVAPVGTANCASATRLAVKPCALRRTAARLRGLTASHMAGRCAMVPSMGHSVRC